MAANDPGQPRLTGTEWTRELPLPGPVPSSALAIGAHPDDIEFGAGGTLATWARAGCVIHHLVLTDGSKGTWDTHADLAALVARRRDEQREAARRLGGANAGDVVFLGHVDGELDSSRAIAGEIAAVIRRLRPDVVFGHDPWKRYRLHPDHRHAGFLTCDAVVAARDPHFFPEQGLAPHRPAALLLWEADEPNFVQDVAAGISQKLAALCAHESQFESTMHAADEHELEAFRRRIRDRLADIGAPHGLQAAEVFALVPDL
jgi:LmbE family N-acetylglucosaminyl deacetylase